MEDRERTPKISPEVYVYATNKHFFNVYDALRIDKMKIEIAGYDQATNRQTGHASAWLDRDDARLMAHLIVNRHFAAVSGGKWEKYGGSQREDGSIESRSIVLEWDEGEGGRFARFPYRFTISNGPGRRTETGGVSPAGEPTARMSMRIPEADMMKMMLCVGDYIRAYETAHHHRLVAQKVRDLRDKLAERAQRDVRDVIEPATVAAASKIAGPVNEPVRGRERANLTAIEGGNRSPVSARRSDAVRAG